ncbi:transcriptional regulator, LytTR family [Prevotellaceae bacterium MN60]|nr:transcriptional regulator, LytTR family [Prevotellaceae bacterium MN60]
MKQLSKELATIAMTVIFLLSFLQPFGIDLMGDNRVLLIIGGSVLAVLSSAMSFVIVEKLLHKDWHNIKGLLLTHAVNIPLLSALILTLISWFTWNSITKAWYCTAGEFSIINYLKVCLEVTLISFFIFILQLYRLRNNHLQQELDEVRAINQLLEDRQPDDPNDAETDLPSPCVLRGNAKNAILEVIPERIIYIESMSNYADVCYLDNDNLQHHALRITMKQLRESLASYTFLIPCHRAFLINLNFVASISGRPSTGCTLQMFQVEKTIPVARAYTKEIHNRLQSSTKD